MYVSAATHSSGFNRYPTCHIVRNWTSQTVHCPRMSPSPSTIIRFDLLLCLIGVHYPFSPGDDPNLFREAHVDKNAFYFPHCVPWMLLWTQKVWMFFVSVPTISPPWRNCLKLPEFSPCDVMVIHVKRVLDGFQSLLVSTATWYNFLDWNLTSFGDFRIVSGCENHWIWSGCITMDWPLLWPHIFANVFVTKSIDLHPC